MKKFENLEWYEVWDNLLKFVGIVALITLIVTIFVFLYQDHSVRYYYPYQREDELEIVCDIDYGSDEVIKLDRSITYDQAIDMANRLNASLKTR